MYEINGAVRQTYSVQDIVQFPLGDLTPDGAFDQITQLGGFLDARAAFGADVKDELTVVAARKKILTEPRQQQENHSNTAK